MKASLARVLATFSICLGMTLLVGCPPQTATDNGGGSDRTDTQSMTLKVPGSTSGNVGLVLSDSNGETATVFGSHDGQGNVTQLDAFEYKDGSGGTLRMVYAADTKRSQRRQSAGRELEVKIDTGAVEVVLVITLNEDGSVTYQVADSSEGYVVETLLSAIEDCRVAVSAPAPGSLSPAEQLCWVWRTLNCVSFIGTATGAPSTLGGRVLELINKAGAFSNKGCEEIAGDILAAIDRGLAYHQALLDWIDSWDDWLLERVPSDLPAFHFRLRCDGDPVRVGPWQHPVREKLWPGVILMSPIDELWFPNSASDASTNADGDGSYVPSRVPGPLNGTSWRLTISELALQDSLPVPPDDRSDPPWPSWYESPSFDYWFDLPDNETPTITWDICTGSFDVDLGAAPPPGSGSPPDGPGNPPPFPNEVVTLDLGGGVTMDLVRIPAWTFMMGSENGGDYEEPVHRVTISRDFYIGRFEVTQGQWLAVMGNNPSFFSGSDGLPVERVEYAGAVAFCAEVSRITGYDVRLPTEAEWEYACRAGTTTEFYFGDSSSELGDYAWHGDNSGSETHMVGGKLPNAWGLYDMHGNVREFCYDWYDVDYYSNSPGSDPSGPLSGLCHVLRGGSWADPRWNCRSAARDCDDPAWSRILKGFRVAWGAP